MLYALSYLGAYLGFIPLLLLLLPRRVVAIAPDHALALLSGLLLLGGLVASVAHIAAGAISDSWLARHGSRRAVIAAGLAGLIGAYGLLAQARSGVMLAAGVTCFQLALNLMFAPLGALMTDYIPDARKGRVAGWLNAGLPLSILMVTALSRYAPTDGDNGFAAVVCLVAALVLPLVLCWPFDQPAGVSRAEPGCPPDRLSRPDRSDLLRVAAARLLMQLGGSLMVNYLYIYLADLHRTGRLTGWPDTTQTVGWLALAASGAAICGALVMGHSSDLQSSGRYSRRRGSMIVAALTAAIALAWLSCAQSWNALVVAYVMFQAALTAYLVLDSAFVAQVVAHHPRRGTWLGLINLTNTLPTIIAPILTLASVARAPDAVALTRMIVAAAVAAGLAAIFAGRVRSRRD